LDSIAYLADELAMDYATTLETQISSNNELLVVASWVLLHITDENIRSSLLKTLLDHNAKILMDNDAICNALSSNAHGSLKIPYPWVCAAKAVYARTVENDPVSEARWLVEGGEPIKAHDVLCNTIGPNGIIEGDYNSMRDILGALAEANISRQVDWDKGAGLYFDYIELVDLQNSTKRSAESKMHVKKLVRKLCGSLEAIATELHNDERTIIEKIALRNMAAHVVRIGNQENALETERVLRLPLTDNAYLEQSKLLSLQFYESQLVKAR